MYEKPNYFKTSVNFSKTLPQTANKLFETYYLTATVLGGYN
jgi:hypothetical protein